MSNRIDDIGKMRSKVDAAGRQGIFDGRKIAKLGTEKNPAVVSVQTDRRRVEIAARFDAKGWKYRIEITPEKPEDITDLTRLLNPPSPKIAGIKIGRNELCSCSSGKKYKNCCGR